MNKAERLAKAKKELEKTLNKTRFHEIKAKHKNNRGIEFPNLKVHSKIPLSDKIGNGLMVRTGAHHPDAKQFPVGNSHKQSLELIYSKDYVQYMNGKKQ